MARKHVKTKSNAIKRKNINNTRKRPSKGAGKAPRSTPWPPPRAARFKRKTTIKK